jgi:nicotinamide-nucleotide amidase
MAAEVTARVGADAIYGTGADRLEAVTGALMAQAERKVAILESATQGEIARLLCSTPEGASVVTQSLVIDGPEALAATLNLSPAKMAEFGWVSEMVAAEAAATLIDTYEGGWGLAVLGSAADSGDVYGEHPGETYLALGTPSTTRVLHYPYGGAGELARRWIVLRALDVLRREALKRLENA